MLSRLFKTGKTAGAEEVSFLAHYDRQFAPLLGGRAPGFRVMFERLEARCRGRETPALIVETGSMRTPGNWAWDGQSTVLWKEFGALYESEIHTVDLDPAAAPVVREACGDAVHIHTGDSVAFLYDFAARDPKRQIDMLYLDSYDFDAQNPFPSAFHHIKELIAIRPCLGPGSIVAIDDNFVLAEGGFTGKGVLAMQWFEHLHIPCLHTGHQFVWQL